MVKYGCFALSLAAAVSLGIADAQPPAPPPKGAARGLGKGVTEVPGSKFVTIYPEGGRVYRKNTFGEGSSIKYNRLLAHTQGVGCSNAFLVSGRSFEQAVNGAYAVLFDYRLCDRVDLGDDRCWLFVSLGANLEKVHQATGGPARIDRSKKTISLEYETVPRGKVVREFGGSVASRMYWIPIDALPDGEYRIRLTRKGADGPSLVRTIRVVRR